MRLPLTAAALLLLSITLAPTIAGQTATGQRRTCSCKSSDASCEANVSCSRHGCTAICGSKDGCYAACGKDVLLTHFTLKLVKQDGRQIAIALSEKTGKQIEFVPRRPNDRFTIDVEDNDVWDALEYLYDSGRVTVNGVDWEKYRQLRKAALDGGKMSVDFNNITVRDALAHLSFLTGLPFRVESGDAEQVITLSLREVTLGEIVSRISEQTGVKIKQPEKSARPVRPPG
jgi:hypothetical protein